MLNFLQELLFRLPFYMSITSSFLDGIGNLSIHGPSIQSFPTEILGEIFTFSWEYAPGGFVENSLLIDKYTPSPWILSHVCRRWRAILLSMPRLWSHVGITATLESDLWLLPAQLRLAGPEIPLTIHLGLKRPLGYTTGWDVYFSTAMTVIAPYLHRCRALSIADLDECEIATLENSGQFAFQQLEILRLPTNKHQYKEDILNPNIGNRLSSLFIRAPLLRVLLADQVSTTDVFMSLLSDKVFEIYGLDDEGIEPTSCKSLVEAYFRIKNYVC